MGKKRCYCPYCDVYLVHNSIRARRDHICGFKHIAAVSCYYQNFIPQMYKNGLFNSNTNNEQQKQIQTQIQEIRNIQNIPKPQPNTVVLKPSVQPPSLPKLSGPPSIPRVKMPTIASPPSIPAQNNTINAPPIPSIPSIQQNQIPKITSIPKPIKPPAIPKPAFKPNIPLAPPSIPKPKGPPSIPKPPVINQTTSK